MNLKYYLRGLGIGVVVTALIMGIATGGSKETLSNDEIKERAKELGMIEETTLLSDVLASEEPVTDPSAETVTEPTEVPVVEPTLEPIVEPTLEPTVEPILEPTVEPTVEPTLKQTPEPTAKPTPKPTPEQTAKPTLKPTTEPTTKPTSEASEEPIVDGTSSVADGDNIIIEVKSGEGSYTVCEKLEAAGLIASASDFDSYLGQNGYDRRIRAGEHEIPANAEPKEIAQILAGEK